MDPIFAAATTKGRGDRSERCLQFWEQIHWTSVANPPAGAIWEAEVGPKCRSSGRAHWWQLQLAKILYGYHQNSFSSIDNIYWCNKITELSQSETNKRICMCTHLKEAYVAAWKWRHRISKVLTLSSVLHYYLWFCTFLDSLDRCCCTVTEESLFQGSVLSYSVSTFLKLLSGQQLCDLEKQNKQASLIMMTICDTRSRCCIEMDWLSLGHRNFDCAAWLRSRFQQKWKA